MQISPVYCVNITNSSQTTGEILATSKDKISNIITRLRGKCAIYELWLVKHLLVFYREIMETLPDFQSIPIFGGLQMATISLLLEQAIPTPRKDNDYFFKQGDIGDSVYIILSGQVAIFRGKEQNHLVNVLGEGDCFGEMALIDHQPRSASVQAITDCEALEISQNTLFDVYQQDVKQYLMLHMNMAREVSRRLREADEYIA